MRLSSLLRLLSLSVSPRFQAGAWSKADSLSDQGEETRGSVIAEHWGCINSSQSTIRGRHCAVTHCEKQRWGSNQQDKVNYMLGLITRDPVMCRLLVMRDTCASFMSENFMIKCVAGWNLLIAFKEQRWRAERDVLSFVEKTPKNEKLYCKRTFMFSEIHRGFLVRRKGVLQMVQSVQKIRSYSKRRKKEFKKKSWYNVNLGNI